MEHSTTNIDVCVICNESNDSGETVQLREKGVRGIEKAAGKRNETLPVKAGQKVHTNCRRLYINPNQVLLAAKRKDSSEGKGEPVNLRSASSAFSFKDDCLFCGKSIAETSRLKDYKEYYPVRSNPCQFKIHEKSKERNDDWGHEVLARVEYSCDLHASDAVYHQVCSVRFRKGRDRPFNNPDTVKRRRTSVHAGGRPKNTSREGAFLKVVQYLEDNDNEQITLQELVTKMDEYLEGEGDSFTVKHMRTRLEEHFGDEIVITAIQKKENVVTFRRTASRILHDFHRLPKDDDPEREKMKIVEVAAKLIKNDIRTRPVISKDTYPGTSDIHSENSVEFLPDSLKLILDVMFVGKDTAKTKLAAIGQAIMQAVRPRVMIAPLQLGLGIQLHHHFASRYLIGTLHNMGFCCSYKEVQRYEQSAAVTNDSEIPGHTPSQFIQYVADNVDHNIQTTDGHGTFHGMGIIAAATPGVKANQNIPRLKVTANELNEIGKINVHFYSLKKSPDLSYGPLSELPDHTDVTSKMDILWKTTWLLKPDRTSWSGTMQMINTHGEYPGQSSVVFMPMIDLNPSDETCIYSTLLWVSAHAKRYDVSPVLTFDQPLWYKANMIVSAEPSNSDVSKVVVRLGGFHTEMSFLGAIGHIMNDSGLQEILTTVYAEKSVSHMLTGKAVARALRGHGMVHMALQSLIVSEVFHLDLISEKPSEELDAIEYETRLAEGQYPVEAIEKEEQDSQMQVDSDYGNVQKYILSTKHDDDAQDNAIIDVNVPDHVSNTPVSVNNEGLNIGETSLQSDADLDAALTLFDSVLTGDISIETACTYQVITRIQDRMNTYCNKVSADSRTARLWIQYIEMVELLREFIKAERTGNWQLHLRTLRAMLPFFTASGHNLYAKSAYLYLVNMHALRKSNPKLYDNFMKGLHVIRRSDRYWAGLSTDLVIEQMLMRSLKSAGGLTRGRGMTDVQRAVWVLSRPATSTINEAMQTFSGEMYTTSEQHKDTNASVRKQDRHDTEVITEYLFERNPFKTEYDLKSLTSGVVSYDSNADQAKQIGERVVSKMIGKKVNEFTFRKKDAVIPMNDKSAFKIDGDAVKIDPQLLFQRLVSAANRSTDETDLPLTYELCTHPPALFETTRQMREADKPALANAMKSNDNPAPNIPDTNDDLDHVLDGGMLLQWIPWENGQTFDNICSTYVKFVKSRYSNVTVVFDGYEGGPNTKDSTHGRRTTGTVGTEVRFTAASVFRGKKKTFLANHKNKQLFINMLSERMNSGGIKTAHATSDADLLIALTAVQCSLSKPTVLVGDDTDLLVLLCYHVSPQSMPVYFQPRPKLNREAVSWDIHRLQQHLGDDVCRNILFLHAILGCDTTSKVYGLGKGIVLKAFEKSEKFRHAASVFHSQPSDVSTENIVHYGEQALLYLYKAGHCQTMDNLRVSKFNDKVAKSTIFVDPKTLPPTSDATRFHSLRVYLQVHDWKGNVTVLNPLDWGWELVGDKLFPVTTTRGPAPSHILKIVRCTCSSGCKTKACSCKKVGLDCSSACSSCKGVSCENSIRPDFDN